MKRTNNRNNAWNKAQGVFYSHFTNKWIVSVPSKTNKQVNPFQVLSQHATEQEAKNVYEDYLIKEKL